MQTRGWGWWWWLLFRTPGSLGVVPFVIFRPPSKPSPWEPGPVNAVTCEHVQLYMPTVMRQGGITAWTEKKKSVVRLVTVHAFAAHTREAHCMTRQQGF